MEYAYPLPFDKGKNDQPKIEEFILLSMSLYIHQSNKKSHTSKQQEARTANEARAFAFGLTRPPLLFRYHTAQYASAVCGFMSLQNQLHMSLSSKNVLSDKESHCSISP